MELHPVKPPRAVDAAIDTLRNAILSGELAAGTTLPPERRLATTLGISRLTLRAAVAHLAAEGLVQARQGSGVSVLDFHQTGGVALLPHLMRRGDVTLLEPFLQLRRAVAAEALAAACVRATPADVDRLTEMAASLAEETDRSALIEGNLRFTQAVLRIADNLPMTLLFNTVAAVYRARPEVAEAMLASEAGVRASFMATVELIRRGDAEAARSAVRRTLEALDAATLAAMETR